MLPSLVLVTANFANSPNGTTAEDGEDAGPSPLAFVATTVKVYDVPGVRPETVQEVSGALGATALVEHVNPPGEDVTV